ncbi:MAG TPA: group II intron reverse transcriptase/maturase [Streptosporangiaceae bacterium]|nr:group II intron reverse transcriptase/maturase [Streptosporangiaceae bacterium]
MDEPEPDGRRRTVSGGPLDGKPFAVAGYEVWQAWEQVRDNKGAPGVDGQSIAAFEERLEDNLYRVWNRMSSGTWFPPPVKAVEIPKAGGTRTLGVPMTADRVAQTVAANRIGTVTEKFFRADSYGYRPGRGAHDALAVARRRCWIYDWVVEFDIRAFSGSVPHDLVVRAVEGLRLPAWVLLYVKRWLAAPVIMPDGEARPRDKGTPQGSAVSPVIASLFLHWAFDAWMDREFPDCPFERYADDGLVHCKSRARAQKVLAALGQRMRDVGLELHPGKTQIVYCKDSTRRQWWDGPVSFDFLGYAFRPRDTMGKNGRFTGFDLAASPKAVKRMSETVTGWQLHRLTVLTWEQLADWIGPVIRGWMAYYGRFRHSELHPLLARINWHVQEWIRAKYRRLKPYKAMKRAWNRITAQKPGLLPHWRWETGAWY